MGKISCVIWDWNGTLLDDVDVCVAAMNELLVERGISPLAGVEHYRAFFGFPVSEYYKNVGFDFAKEPFEALAMAYMVKYRQASQSCGLHKGAIQVLKTVLERGLTQIILSASEKQDLQRQLDDLELTGYFSSVLGLQNIYAKSKMELGKSWMKEQAVNPDEAILIGDTTHDFEVARELGCSCVLIANGHQSKSRLLTCDCPVVDRIDQVLDYIVEA